MPNPDYEYMGDAPFGKEEHYFNPDVYAALNQIVEETDSIDNHINTQLHREIKKINTMVDKIEQKVIPVPPIELIGQDVIIPDCPFKSLSACCTWFCDQLSVGYNPEKCKLYCQGEIIPPIDGELCCLLMQVIPSLICERIIQLVKQCGDYRISCEGTRGTPIQYFMVINIPCNKVPIFLQCLNHFQSGIVFQIQASYSGPCDRPPPPPPIDEDCPPEVIEKCCDKPPPIDIGNCPPPIIKCPEPKIINNVNCPPPLIENKIVVNLADKPIKLECPEPKVICSPVITCPPPKIINEIDCVLKLPEPERYCDLVELTDEEKEECLMRMKTNHLDWMTSKEGMSRLEKYVFDYGFPTTGLTGGDAFAMLNDFRNTTNRRLRSRPILR